MKQLTPAVKRWAGVAVDAIFPPRCFLCADIISQKGHVCVSCWRELQFITAPQCGCCGHPFEYAVGEDALCGACIQDEPAYDKARAVLSYDDASRKLVTRFKFSDMTHSGHTLASWMIRAGEQCTRDADVIVPVPLHRMRLVKRRYNQAAILARYIARQTELPLLVDGLKRLKHTTPQSGLSRRQRKLNVKGAFAVPSSRLQQIEKKRILLIDDVMTTGATLEACAKALKKAGAAQVRVLTLARTLMEY